MSIKGYQGPHFVNNIAHPVTLIAFLITISLGTWVILRTWF